MQIRNTSLEQKHTEDELITFNYWREIKEEIGATLHNLSGIILLTHNSIEFTDIVDILNKVKPTNFTNVLYISLIRSYDFMKMALLTKPLHGKRIFFIDCVSGFAFPAEQEEQRANDCIYHKPPCTLEEMKSIIQFGISKANPDIVVIDSLSQFINFSRPTEVEISDLYKFLRSLREGTLNIMQDTFILLYDSKLGIMQNLPRAFIDLILKVEIIKDQPRWRG